MKKLIIFLFCVVQVLSVQVALAQPKATIMSFRIDDEIDPRMARRVRLAFEKAKAINADVVLIEMDTYGGILTDANDIRKLVLEFPKPVWVHINKNAASAGALIALACDSIYMASAASMGAATVVNGNDGAAAPDKYQSYMRSLMRATAEANRRNPKFAEAMVDGDVFLDTTIKQKGQVLTFTTEEAIRYGYCEGKYETTEAVLKANNKNPDNLMHFELSWVERIIAMFLNPFISGLLIVFIIGGLYYEMQHPGIGFALLVSVVSATLYFVPYYLNGLAENWELLVFFVGVILLALEIFVIPGFGVAGVSGLVLMGSSLILMMLNNDYFNFDMVPENSLVRAGTTVLLGILGSVGIVIFGGIQLMNSRRMKKLTLQTTMSAKEGYTTHPTSHSLFGMRGTAYTVLRPSGKVMIDNNLYDALSRGEYIEQGAEIIVVGEDTSSLKVKAV